MIKIIFVKSKLQQFYFMGQTYQTMSNKDQSGKNLNYDNLSEFALTQISNISIPKSYINEFNQQLRAYRAKLNEETHADKEIFDYRNNEILQLKDYFRIDSAQDFLRKQEALKQRKQIIRQRRFCDCCYSTEWDPCEDYDCCECQQCGWLIVCSSIILCPVVVPFLLSRYLIMKCCGIKQYTTVSGELKQLYRKHWRKVLLELKQQEIKISV